MPVRAKSIYEPPSARDGLRVLATQYWARGVARDRVDEYVRALAPSRELLHAFRDGEIGWPELRRRYFGEMKRPEALAEIERLAGIARRRVVTVMCVCDGEKRCHRSLLRGLIERAAAGM